MLLFFFSSRRRHTRLQGDWSSDVCSSDLDHLHGCRIQLTLPLLEYSLQSPDLVAQLDLGGGRSDGRPAHCERSSTSGCLCLSTGTLRRIEILRGYPSFGLIRTRLHSHLRGGCFDRSATESDVTRRGSAGSNGGSVSDHP